jgi:Tfp pilus assembly protein PilX
MRQRGSQASQEGVENKGKCESITLDNDNSQLEGKESDEKCLVRSATIRYWKRVGTKYKTHGLGDYVDN